MPPIENLVFWKPFISKSERQIREIHLTFSQIESLRFF